MDKIAIISLNETALELAIYKVSGSKYSLALLQKQPFALGKEIEKDELLSPQLKNSMIEILKVYRKMIENYGVQR